MAVVKFTLSEEGVSVLRDALACLGKFSDEVSLEAKRDRVRSDSLHILCHCHPLLKHSLLVKAGFHGLEYVQVGIRLLRLRHEPFLLKVPLCRCCTEQRQVLLQTLQPGGSESRLQTTLLSYSWCSS
jgi:hypothetical protein